MAETFFAIIHRRCLENGLQLNKHVLVEDIEGHEAPQHFYINEFVEFFQLQGTLPVVVKPKRYTMGGGDDEVIMQTPEDGLFSAKSSSSYYGVRPVHEPCTTLHLDGEQSIGSLHMVSFFSVEGGDDLKRNLKIHEEDEPSLQSSMELAECIANSEFQVVSAKQAPFAQIQNHVHTNFSKTLMNPPAHHQNIEQGKFSDLVAKRSYQSPLQ